MRNQTDPGSKSAAEVQREVRESRAEVEHVLDAIQDRLSPGQMFDQAVAYLRGSGGREFLNNFGATMRDNPVPVALLGTGLAWLMLSGPRPRRFHDEDEDLLDEYDDDGTVDHAAAYYEDVDFVRPLDPAAGAEPGEGTERGFVERASGVAGAAGANVQGLAESARDTAQDLGTKAQGLAEGARDTAQGWVAGARESGREWRAGTRAAARRARARAGRYGRRAQRSFLDTLHEQPLVLGAVGLAVGAAIGAALPATETEDEWLGETRDRVKDRAAEAGAEQLGKAAAAATAAYDAARDEAERQGLTPESAMSAAEAVERKAERVAKAATEAAKSEAERQKLGQAGTG
jgi:hypothetical protein